VRHNRPRDNEADARGFEINHAVPFVHHHFAFDVSFDVPFDLVSSRFDFRSSTGRPVRWKRVCEIQFEYDGCDNADADEDQHGDCPRFQSPCGNVAMRAGLKAWRQ
jgi:hypothetical protein